MSTRDVADRSTPTPSWFLPAFVVGAYALSWSWWLPLIAAGAVTEPGLGWPTHLPGLLGPAMSAVVVTGFAFGRAGLADLWRRMTDWRSTRTAWMLVLLTSASLLLAPLVAVVRGQPVPSAADFVTYSGAPAAMGPAVVLYVWIVNGFGEETGWRGILVEHLHDRLGLRRTALATAVIVAGWHLPLFWIAESFRAFSVLEVVGWVVGLTLGCVLLAWLYMAGGRSILLVATWHTAYNFTTATDATTGVTAAVSSMIVMAIAITILVRNPGVSGRT